MLSFLFMSMLFITCPFSSVFAQTSCSSTLCNTRYSEQTFIGAHNSPALRNADNGFSLSGNQFYNVSVQLEAGVRLLQGQGHFVNGEVHLCHARCELLDAGLLVDYLRLVRTFLDENPTEVVTLLWVNVGVPLESWAAAYAAAGLTAMSYVPNMSAENITMEGWPTIAELVNENRRVITFLASGADQSVIPWLLDEFTYIFETNFRVQSPSSFSCDVDRPPNTERGEKISLVNHFLYASFLGIQYPNVSYVDVTNGVGPGEGNLLTHATNCRQTFGRRPNFLLVDFFDRGAVFEVQDTMNDVSTSTENEVFSRVTPDPIPATATATNAGGSDAGNSGNSPAAIATRPAMMVLAAWMAMGIAQGV